MDINFPTDPISSPVVASRFPDLLAQLGRAGTLEAEVIRMLPGQLLLGTRLGEILTRNTLDYKPGDRMNLRLDQSAGYPVLKTSPAPRKPINLDATQNPELTRALPPGRPMLAIVTRVVAKQAEIQLAGQILKLPRPVELVKNQLLGLRRIDSRQSIEVTPLDRKSVYKAVLQQLLPAQAQNEPASLVKLLGLVNGTLATIRPAAEPGQAPGQNSEARARTIAAHAPQPFLATGKPGVASAAATDALRMQYPAGGTTATGSTATARTPPLDPGFVSYAQQSRALPADLRETRPAPAGAGREFVGGEAQRNVANTSLRPLPASKPAQTAGSSSGAATPAQDAGRAGVSATDGLAAAVNAIPGDPRHRIAAPHGRPGTRPQSSDSSSPPAQGGALQRGANGSGALWSLLQLVNRFPEIDAARLKNWFEFAGLVRHSGSDPADAKSMPPGVLLKRLADPENFARELLQSIRSGNGRPTDTDAAAGRQAAAESLLPHIREGVKLVEQSLAQNLMQRASLGLQQETQQPLALSLALPLLDAHQVKPLQVELAQRNQAQQEADRGWDIRLSFDFADLGPVSCHVVVEGLAIGASFYCELEPTRARIGAALPQLRERFYAAGFSPGELHSFPGRAAPGATPSAADFCESLIDVEA